MSKQLEKREHGAALIMSLVLVILILGLAASYLMVSVSNRNLTVTTRDTLQALYVAETGLSRALHMLNVGDTTAFKEINSYPCPGSDWEHPTCGLPPDFDNETGRYTFEKDDLGGSHANCRFRIPGYFPPGVQVYAGSYEVATPAGGRVELGRFSVMYVPLVPNQEAKLIATGDYSRSRRVVEVTLQRQNELTESWKYGPPWSIYAILTDDTYRGAGSWEVYGDMWSNGDIDLRGNGFTVGDSGYTDDEGNPEFPGNVGAVGDITGHLDNINGDITPSGSRVPIPQFDLDAIVAAAEKVGLPVTRVTGDQVYTNETIPPGVLIVEGNIDLRAHVDAQGIIIATGTIDVAANATIGDLAATGTNLMLWAGDDVIFRGNAEINGIVFANDLLDFAGNPTINGSLISGINLSAEPDFGHGNPTVNFIPPEQKDDTPGLPDILVEITPKPWKIVSWRESGHVVDPLMLTIPEVTLPELPEEEPPPEDETPPADDTPPVSPPVDGKGGGKG